MGKGSTLPGNPNPANDMVQLFFGNVIKWNTFMQTIA
jgi:hypothetical protein